MQKKAWIASLQVNYELYSVIRRHLTGFSTLINVKHSRLFFVSYCTEPSQCSPNGTLTKNAFLCLHR